MLTTEKKKYFKRMQKNFYICIFREKIQIWDKLLKISHRFRLQNTIGND